MEKPEAIEPAIIERSQDLVRRLDDHEYDFFGLDFIAVEYEQTISELLWSQHAKATEALSLLDEAWARRTAHEAEKIIETLSEMQPDPIFYRVRRLLRDTGRRDDPALDDIAKRVSDAWDSFLYR